MFKLPELPFSNDALEPLMSRATLDTHHGKHHAAYVKNMNAILADIPNAPTTLEEVVALSVRENNKKLFNNAAQTWNHAFFWESLSPTPQNPEGPLKAALEKAFGSVDGFREKFAATGVGHFASGWAWLVADKAGDVKLIDTHDAATALTEEGLTPLLVSDVWEHAYYIDFKNDRAAFLKGFTEKLANWRFAESQYAAAQKGEKGWRYPS
ncbi:MAG TPA: superoxide dismutase [Terricaulis sp.]|nr:superoxide dismutase [Terricaulis sp.]